MVAASVGIVAKSVACLLVGTVASLHVGIDEQTVESHVVLEAAVAHMDSRSECSIDKGLELVESPVHMVESSLFGLDG